MDQGSLQAFGHLPVGMVAPQPAAWEQFVQLVELSLGTPTVPHVAQVAAVPVMSSRCHLAPMEGHSKQLHWPRAHVILLGGSQLLGGAGLAGFSPVKLDSGMRASCPRTCMCVCAYRRGIDAHVENAENTKVWDDP